MGTPRDTKTSSEGVDGGKERDDHRPAVTIIEKKVGKYECPEFISSPNEEERIRKPWKYGVIVKLLGRKIGYRALESRLQQLWVQKGVINIVDIGKLVMIISLLLFLAWMITNMCLRKGLGLSTTSTL